MSNIELSDNQKQRLIELSKTAPELIKHRAKLILCYAEGKPTIEAAREAGISRGRARYWKRQFFSRGMEIFFPEPEEKVYIAKSEEAINPSVTEPVEGNTSDQKGEVRENDLEEIPYPELQNTIGVTSEDSLAEAGKKVWLYHFAVMLSHEQGTMLGEDIEELHDMRVATRRMRSAFDIFGPAFNPKIMRRYQKGLRGLGRKLGQVRDMEVILENGLRYQRKLGEPGRLGMDLLLNEWKQAIDSQRIKLVKHLQSQSYTQFKQDFNRFLHTPVSGIDTHNPGNHAISRIRDIVPILIYSRYAAVNAYEAILPTASVNQLHALRIEFKKFRYTLEYFKEILNENVVKTINEIKQYQDHLGELHDADVACQLVRDFLKNLDENQTRLPIQERTDPGQIVTYLAYLHAERYHLMVTFLELWQKFSRPEFRQNLAQAISLL